MRKVFNRFPIINVSLFVLGLVVVYLAFKNGQFDEWVTGLFYDPMGDENVWVQKQKFWVQFCYRSASLLTVLMGLSVIVGYISSFFWRDLLKYRSLFLLMFLSIALGPGLFVNAVLKDNWGRPRPRETVAFGGDKAFQAPFVISDQGGKSFPCGHCSVVFALSGFAFWFGRDRKKLFHLLFWSSMAAGMIMGMARVAVGAHYFSDVLVSGMVVVGVTYTLLLLFPSLKHPVETGDEQVEVSPVFKIVLIGVGSVAFGAMAMFALMSFPFHYSENLKVDFPDRWFHETDKVVLTVIGVDSTKLATDPMLVEVHGDDMLIFESKGFGVPWCNVSYSVEVLETEKELELLVTRSGLFSELKTSVLSMSSKSQ